MVVADLLRRKRKTIVLKSKSSQDFSDSEPPELGGAVVWREGWQQIFWRAGESIQ